MKHTPMSLHTAPRPASFVEAHFALPATYRETQCAFFAAATNAGLSRDRSLQIRGCNEALGLRGSDRITSRAQLTQLQLRALTVAIENDFFADDWTWGHPYTVAMQIRTIEVAEIQFVSRFGSA